MSKERVYKGYRLINHGYYQPDHYVWWEAENLKTRCADHHAHNMRDLKKLIDDYEGRDVSGNFLESHGDHDGREK